MRKQLEFVDSRGNTGGTITFQPGDKQLVKAIWLIITGTFVAVPGAAIDWTTDLSGGWAIRHQGGNNLGDLMATNTLWPLRQLTASLDGYFNETNSGVGASAFSAVLGFPIDHGRARGMPHRNSLPMDGGEKLQVVVPALSAAGKLETADYSVKVFVEFGDGIMRYLPRLMENSATGVASKTEYLPDNLFVFMCQEDSGASGTLQLAVYDGKGVNVVHGPFSGLVPLCNTKYDFESASNDNFHWVFYESSDNLLNVKGSGYKVVFTSGSGNCSFAHVAIDTDVIKLLRSAEIVETDQAEEIVEASQSGASSAEISALNPKAKRSKVLPVLAKRRARASLFG